MERQRGHRARCSSWARIRAPTGRGRSRRSPFRTRKRSSSSPRSAARRSGPAVPERPRAPRRRRRRATASHLVARARPHGECDPKPHAITTSVIPWRAHPIEHVGDERAIDEGHGGLRPRSGSAAAGGSPRRPPGSGPASAGAATPRPLPAPRPDRSATGLRAVRPSDALVDEPGLAKRDGSRKLRPSMTSGVSMRSRSEVQSSSANSGHSVTRIAASAPSSAVSAESQRSMLGRSSCAASLRDRVIAADDRALTLEPRREHEAGGLPHVVGVRLEREPQQRDPLAGQRPEVAARASSSPAASAAR